jgi:hypothetical protein
VNWLELGDLARRERAVVDGGRWDELPALQDARGALIAALPSPLPAEAEPVLRVALAQSRATEQALQVALARTEAELGAVRRGRRAMAGYAGAVGHALERRA